MNVLTVTLIFIYLIFVLIIGPIMFKEKVHSVYSRISDSDNKHIELKGNTLRRATIQHYFDNLSQEPSRFYHQNRLANKSSDHLIVIIVNRPDLYLGNESRRHVLSQLIQRIDIEVRSDLKSGMFICNQSMENSPELDFLSKFYPIYKHTSIARKKRTTTQDDLKNNFINCVRLGLSTISYVPKYVTVLRDTVVPYDHFVSTLRVILDSQVDTLTRRGETVTATTNSWMFLHLHEPIHLRGFGWDSSSIRELILVCIVGALVFYIYFKLVESFFHSQRLAFKISLALQSFGAILFFTLAVAMGRPYLTELRRNFPRYYRLYEPSSPIEISAVSMSAVSAKRMMTQLQKILCSNYQTFSHTWHHLMYSFEVPGYIVSPSLVRYV